MISSTKVCTCCKEDKLLNEYYTRSQRGKKYPEARCKRCSIARTSQRKTADPEYAERMSAISSGRSAAKRRFERANGINRDVYIYNDSKAGDRRKGLEFDLTREFIATTITAPCLYCDDTETQMTLDRIDNTLGHVTTNVVPACVRCNLVRGNMPYDAWLTVARGMKEARLLGLFGDWQPKKNGGA